MDQYGYSNLRRARFANKLNNIFHCSSSIPH
nr:MAG TPA: hypothetical protein [Caudoviricetes sp.]